MHKREKNVDFTEAGLGEEMDEEENDQECGEADVG